MIYAIVNKKSDNNKALQMIQLTPNMQLIVVNVPCFRQILPAIEQVNNKLNSGEFKLENETSANERMLREFLSKAIRYQYNPTEWQPSIATEKKVRQLGNLPKKQKLLWI